MPGLAFRPDGTFTVVQFTDTHLTDLGEADRKTLAMMGRILDAEKPDFVALTGDVVFSWESPDPERALRIGLGVIHERGLPWGMVFGNHDDEGTLSRAELFAIQRGFATCRSEAGPAGLPGPGNYVLTVASANGGPGARLAFLDSGDYARKDPTEYAFITPEQSAWFRGALAGSAAPTLVFFHIPLPEYLTVWQTRTCRGVKHEDVCAPKHNSGFFATLKAAGCVLGTFVGHDHINDYDGDLDGIRLCYGRGSGFGTYGKEGFPHGARVIRLREGAATFETWLRLEDGSTVTEPPLHQPDGRT